MLFWTNAFPSEWCKRWPKRKERGTAGSSLFHKSLGQRGSRSRTHVRSIYDVLSFLGDLCPRVPLSLSLSQHRLLDNLYNRYASQRLLKGHRIPLRRLLYELEYRKAIFSQQMFHSALEALYLCIRKTASPCNRCDQRRKETIFATTPFLSNFIESSNFPTFSS